MSLILKLMGEPGYLALVLLNSTVKGKFNGGWSKHHPWEGPHETSFPWQALGGPCVSVREWWTLTSGVIHPNGSGESRRRDAATSRRVQRVARCGHWRLSSRVRYSIAFNFSRLTADDIVHLSWRGGLKNNKISCASGCEVATPSVH